MSEIRDRSAKNNGRRTWTLRIGREIAQGLAAAHGRGPIHRDIKPANVWLEHREASGRVKIVDFGLARAASSDSANLTQQGAIVGTPAYMAPEQASGDALDPRCDLFSLGCVLYRMATGAVPFKGATLLETVLAVAKHQPTPPRELNPWLDDTSVRDLGLEHLRACTGLEYLKLGVAAPGAAKLQQALPKCKIEWDGSGES